MKKILVALSIAAIATIGNSAFAAGNEGFRPLFNGKDLTGWHLRNPKGHNSWSIEPGGVVKNTVNPGEHGTDLVTDSKFRNFTVRYEFMVPDGSNSGFYLRGRHELQILGDYKSGKATKNGNGSIYNFKAPDVFASKPGDEWQTAEATIIDQKITAKLNMLRCGVGVTYFLNNSIGLEGILYYQNSQVNYDNEFLPKIDTSSFGLNFGFQIYFSK